MAQHNEDTKHSIALSFADGSYWCYNCDSYIDSQHLRSARIALSDKKTSDEKPSEIETKEKERNAAAKEEEVKKLEVLFKLLGLEA